MLGLPGYLEVTIVVVLLLLLFGGKRIPAVMRSIGQSITSFKEGIHDSDDPKDSSTNSST